MKKKKNKFEKLIFTGTKKSKIPLKKSIYLNFRTRIILSLIVILLLFIIIGLSSYKIYTLSNSPKDEFEEGYVNYSICRDDSNCNNNINIDNINKIDSILLNYNYFYKSSISRSHNLKYWIDSTIYIENDKEEIFRRRDRLLSTKEFSYISKNIDISENISINMKDYIDLYKKNINKNIYPSMYVNFTLYLDNNGIISSISSFNLLIKENDVSFATTSLENDVLVNEDVNNYIVLLSIICFIFIIICLIFIINTTNLIFKTVDCCNKYIDEINEILVTYKKDIIISNNYNHYNNVIKVISFDELYKIKKKLKKKILFYNINDIKCIFVLEDKDVIYQYTIKCNN